MSPVSEPFEGQDQLDSLLEQAAMEQDRAKFHELLRKINRLRAARWLASGVERPGFPPANLNLDSFSIFAGPPNRDAARLETVIGLDQARVAV
jgi:hypothetical protein